MVTRRPIYALYDDREPGHYRYHVAAGRQSQGDSILGKIEQFYRSEAPSV